jgi:hypothetical protein
MEVSLIACAIGLACEAEPMKRKLKWPAIVLAVSLLGFGTTLLLWPRDRITAESWQKIRIGMTEGEVTEILGGRGMTEAEDLAEHNRLVLCQHWNLGFHFF